MGLFKRCGCLPKIEVLVVMGQVILLQLTDIAGEGAMVQPVVRAVVADVSENASRKHRHGHVPVIPKDCVCQLVKGRGEDQEQCRRHDQSVFVHG